MRLITQFSVISTLAAVVAVSWWISTQDGDALSGDSTPKRGSTTLVLVETLAFTSEISEVRAVGTGEALKSASIYPSVSGEVVEVTFEAGKKVSEGMVLLRLKDKHQSLAVDLAKVALKAATRRVRRLEQIAPRGAASVARLQTAQTEQESARLRLEQAWAALRDRNVYAPFDGVVGLTDIERGDRISKQTKIATLDDRSSILVEFNLSEKYADRITIGDMVSVRSWTQRQTHFKGRIVELGSRINPVSRSLRVKALIPNPEDSIRPGTSFEVSINFTGRAYATIPEVAVLWSRDGAYIWRVENAQAEKVFVSIIRRNKGRILVDGPLQEGDIIVVEGVQGLRAGQQIRTKPFAIASDKHTSG